MYRTDSTFQALVRLAACAAGLLVVLAVALPSSAQTSEATPEQLIEALRAARVERDALATKRDGETGERRDLSDEQLWQQRLAGEKLLDELANQLEKRIAAGEDVSAIQNQVARAVREAWPAARQELLDLEEQSESLRAKRDSASPEEAAALTKRVRLVEQRLEESYHLLADSLTMLASTGVDLTDERTFTTEKLIEWAELLSARLRVLVRERDELAQRLAADPESADLKAEQRSLKEQLDQTIATLQSATNLMGTLEIPTTPYRQALIAATGQITSDILDREIALGLLRKMRDQIIDTVASGAPSWLFKALFFGLILLGFRTASRLARRIVTQSIRASKVNLSQLLQETLIAWSARAVMLLGVLVAASQLGIEIGALLAGLGIAGFVLGFALQDSLSNFAAGAMILVYRPFDVGDVVEAAGVSGSVSRMTLVSTTILTFDNQTLIVPNSKIWGDVIRNVTAQSIRRVDLVFGISYGDNIDHADRVLRELLRDHGMVLDQPQPIVEVYELGDSSVNFIVRPWVKTENYWPVYWSLTRQVKQRFDAEGISIPFPQRDVHHHFDGAGSPPQP